MRWFRSRYVFLFGGLGNQLFQFAYAHYIAESTQKRVILLDATGRLRVSRKFELGLLVSGCSHGVSGFSLSVFSIVIAKMLNFINRINMFFNLQGVEQNHSEKFSRFNVGQYQEIKFIEFIEDHILLDIRKLILEKSLKSKLFVKEGIRLAVHIRRGDYDAAHHGHLSIDYYTQIFSRLDYDYLIVHTDDSEIAKRLREDFPESVIYGPAEATAWDVLIDLASSDIVLTANSTLSWWGAWLCVQNGGRAHLPSIWFKSEDQPPPALIEGFIIEESIWD